ncbi:hypothetical protein QMA78_26895 [Burkholderia pseudomallei]|uniref:hypothetical protein n=1 Tax=Burkholderia pseudomallei TaxID=28450 RepID=UPI002DB8EA1C|nr:hypothetical protein [Burkholderia pseudomallei]MEB5494157.1 hypothetical protein [Burkholderia pseudomallei]
MTEISRWAARAVMVKPSTNQPDGSDGGGSAGDERHGRGVRGARRERPATPRFVTRFVARFSTRKQPLSARRTCFVDTAFTPHSRRIHAETRPARR